MTTDSCQVCTAVALEVIEDFAALPRVTSDSKPWPAGGWLAVCRACGAVQKRADAAWLGETRRIYRDYEMYHLSHGAEQLVFGDVGESTPRAQRLIEFVIREGELPRAGALLDIGCGTGEALARFSRALPEWRLHGSELTDRSLPTLRQLRNFVTLYTVPPAEIGQTFDVVSMIHSLEHMPAPLRTLADAVERLGAGGLLFIEVPDLETSPFDLLVADHLMHFTRATLEAVAGRAGVAIVSIGNQVVPKENTLLGRRGLATAPPLDPAPGVRLAHATVGWLKGVVESVHALAASSPIGLFGTAVAAMALYGANRDRVAFFVDEDPTRIGATYDGKPILAPSAVPREVPVFVALPPERARPLTRRLSEQGIRLISPPAVTPFP